MFLTDKYVLNTVSQMAHITFFLPLFMHGNLASGRYGYVCKWTRPPSTGSTYTYLCQVKLFEKIKSTLSAREIDHEQ